MAHYEASSQKETSLATHGDLNLCGVPSLRRLEEGVRLRLGALHARRMLYLDLKLENVLGLGGDNSGRYVLCDFGSCTTRVLPAERTRSEALAEEDYECDFGYERSTDNGPCVAIMATSSAPPPRAVL